MDAGDADEKSGININDDDDDDNDLQLCAKKRGGAAPPQAPVPAQLSGIKHHTSTHLCLQGMICKLILQYVQKVSQMNSQNLEDAYVSAVLASLRKIKSTLHCKLSTIRICVMCQCFKTAILPSLSRV